MSKIKKYNLFLESSKEIDIYDFANMLKGWQPFPSLSEIKKHSERFIGPGIYDRVQKLVDGMFNVLEEVDMEHIKDALYDVFDEFPEKHKRYHLCVLYCNKENLKEPIERRYNGSMSVGEDKERSRKFIICHILLDMLSPTFSIGYPSIQIRETDEQIDVTDSKWNCVNFNIDNYEISKKEGQRVYPTSPDYKKRGTFISELDLNKLRKYNIEDFFQCYKPGIYIEICDDKRDTDGNWKISIKKVEDLFDEYLPRILHGLEYEKVLWEIPRQGRRFDETTYELYDYTLKVLLKM